MAKVEFRFNNGRVKVMEERFARTLQKIRRGSYLTRDIAAPVATPPQPAVAPPPPPPPAVEGDALESMSLEELHAFAKEQGVEVHHRAGADKVRAALREKAAE